MSDIHWAISPVISSLDIKGTRVSTFSIRWDTIALDYPPNSMRYKPDNIPLSPQKRILLDIESNWINWDLALIGVERSEQVIPNITVSLNGFLVRFIMRGLTSPPIKQNPLKPSLRLLKIMEITMCKLHAMIIGIVLL